MRIIAGLLFFLAACSGPQKKESVSFKDLEPLKGNWSGTQDMLAADDTSWVSYPTTSAITSIKDSLELSFTISENGGAGATEKGILYIHEDGSKLNFGPSEYDIQSVKRENNDITVIAAKEDEDNEKKADIRLTITIEPSKLIMLREVRYKGTDKYFTRINLQLAKK